MFEINMLEYTEHFSELFPENKLRSAVFTWSSCRLLRCLCCSLRGLITSYLSTWDNIPETCAKQTTHNKPRSVNICGDKHKEWR